MEGAYQALILEAKKAMEEFFKNKEHWTHREGAEIKVYESTTDWAARIYARWIGKDGLHRNVNLGFNLFSEETKGFYCFTFIWKNANKKKPYLVRAGDVYVQNVPYAIHDDATVSVDSDSLRLQLLACRRALLKIDTKKLPLKLKLIADPFA